MTPDRKKKLRVSLHSVRPPNFLNIITILFIFLFFFLQKYSSVRFLLKFHSKLFLSKLRSCSVRFDVLTNIHSRVPSQLLLRKKAAEELKKEQERKAAERRRIIEERCGKPKNVDDASEGTLKAFP